MKDDNFVPSAFAVRQTEIQVFSSPVVFTVTVFVVVVVIVVFFKHWSAKTGRGEGEALIDSCFIRSMVWMFHDKMGACKAKYTNLSGLF